MHKMLTVEAQPGLELLKRLYLNPMIERKPLWTPSHERIERSNLLRYAQFLKNKALADVAITSSELYDWSIDHPREFWKSLWDFFEITHSRNFSSIMQPTASLPGTEWFNGAQLNFAENLLRYRDDYPALVFWGESLVCRRLSYNEIFAQVASLATYLRGWGVQPGDRVAACIPNMPEAIIGMLATTAIGAIWSSCSPDFGVDGIVDRFEQITPKIFIAPDGYYFKGNVIDCSEKISRTLERLPSVEQLVTISYTQHTHAKFNFRHQVDFADLTGTAPVNFIFEQLQSQHPIYIMFSSGTTGKPKCIVHGAIGTLLEHRKELELHSDLKRGERIFYQTTCGWMMWNWLASGLACGSTLILFDGSPLHENSRILFRLAQEERVNIFGTNAKFISLLEKNAVSPGNEFDLSELKTVLSTGSVLTPGSFDYVYREIKSDLLLSSVSGGTDIMGCFALGSPALPVYRGTLQTRSLGLAVEVYDPEGRSLVATPGELVCTKPFPSMPIRFWNDPDGDLYRKAYFNRFPGIWTHGDYVELLADGGMIFLGRSDATLNPGGVRIGTSEIYHQLEKVPEIMESLVVAYRSDSDEQIVLFVVLRDQQTLTPVLEKNIRFTIRQNLTPFHVPQYIFVVSDLPRTQSGKIMELAVRNILSGKRIENLGALSNPDSLAIFHQIARQFRQDE